MLICWGVSHVVGVRLYASLPFPYYCLWAVLKVLLGYLLNVCISWGFEVLFGCDWPHL